MTPKPHRNHHLQHPIDIVIRWAGIPSPQKIRKCKAAGLNPDALFPPQTHDLKYAFRSLKYLPWARRVYLLLDDDELLPPWLHRTHPALKIVRHSAFIPPQFLPTYNSNVIDSFVHCVPDLAEHFIVLDDECFVLKPTPPTAFFRNGLPITRHYEGRDRHRLRPSPILFVKMWQLAIRTYKIRYTRIQHQAQPFLKSRLVAYHDSLFAPALAAMHSHRTRHPLDVNVLRFGSGLMSTLGHNIMFKTSNDYDLFVEGPELTPQQEQRIIAPSTRPTFLCINNTHPSQTPVYRLLRRLLPKKSPYEL